MKAKKTKKLSPQQKIERTKNKVRKFLGDVDWFFDMKYWEKGVIFSETPDVSSPSCAAEVVVDLKYTQSTIKIYPAFFNQTPKDQVNTLIHELVHVLTQPTKEIMFEILNGHHVTERRVKEVNEEITSRITNRLMSFLEGGTKYLGAAYKEYLK